MNIYDIRKDDNLYYVLPTDTILSNRYIPKARIAVLVNLFYFEEIDWYLAYLKKIPDNIALNVFSPDDRIIKTIRTVFKDRKLLSVVKKQNRGRDISALLVTAKNLFCQYEYVCFIHDKKWRDEKQKNDVSMWTYNLWENTISSVQYIANVLTIFENNKHIGLLVPPEPISETMGAWYYTGWSNCFEATKDLAKQLDLKTDIDITKPPISLSTVFWCRTMALKKLIDYPWRYEDFPEEPLPVSGTISHAIERILAYVAQDAGYKTGMIMTDEYASKLLSFVQYHLHSTFMFLEEYVGARTLKHIEEIRSQKRTAEEYCKNHKNIYLYGAGIVGKRVLKCIKAWGYLPKGFIVSDNQKEDTYEGLPIKQLDNLNIENNSGIIVTVSSKYKEEIIKNLHNHGLSDVLIWEN